MYDYNFYFKTFYTASLSNICANFIFLPLINIRHRLLSGIKKDTHLAYLRHEVSKGGFFSLWKNYFQKIKISSPNHGVNFMCFHFFRKEFKFKNPMAGGCAGVLAYLLESHFLNSLAFKHHTKVKNIFDAYRVNWKIHGLRGFYPQFLLCVAHSFTYRCLYFSLFDWAKGAVRVKNILLNFFLSYNSATVSIFANLPLTNLNHTILIAETKLGRKVHYLEGIRIILKEKGWKGFYTGGKKRFLISCVPAANLTLFDEMMGDMVQQHHFGDHGGDHSMDHLDHNLDNQLDNADHHIDNLGEHIDPTDFLNIMDPLQDIDSLIEKIGDIHVESLSFTGIDEISLD